MIHRSLNVFEAKIWIWNSLPYHNINHLTTWKFLKISYKLEKTRVNVLFAKKKKKKKIAAALLMRMCPPFFTAIRKFI